MVATFISNTDILCYSLVFILLPDRRMIGFVCILFCYTIATVFQLYYVGTVMYEMRRRNYDPT